MKEVLRNLKAGTIFDLDDSMYKTRYFVLEQCETGTKIMTLHIPTDWIVGWKYGETVDYNKSNVNRELKKIMEKKEAVTGSDCFIPHKIQYSDEATWEGKLRVLTCEEAVKYNDIIVITTYIAIAGIDVIISIKFVKNCVIQFDNFTNISCDVF